MYNSHTFLNPGIGIGKTTLLCLYAIGKALNTKEQVIVINLDSNLLFRDYKRVIEIINELKDT